MKRMAMCVAFMAAAVVGCQGKTVHCERCNKDVAVGTYCPACEKVVGYTGTVHCDKCKKDMPAGSYCAACNRFMLPGKVHCAKCNKDVPTGTWCEGCKKYVGVPGVTYDEATKKPKAVAGGKDCACGGTCDTCKKK